MVGDALGRPFEMMSPRDARLAPALRALLLEATSLRYSDDTEMMLAVATSMVRSGGVSASDILASLASSYDPARGYGHGMKLAVEAFRSGRRPAATASWAEGSRGSGGAVRVVPIACAYHHDLDLVAALAEDAAGTTHAHPVGRAGAVVHAVALASAIGHGDGWSRETFAPRLLATILAQPALRRADELVTGLASILSLVARSASAAEAAGIVGNGVLAQEAVPLALFCFLRWAPDLEAVVTNAVLAGGDTDTIAAMSGALCGALVGEEAIPSSWLRRLDHEHTGPSHARALADATAALWAEGRVAGRE